MLHAAPSYSTQCTWTQSHAMLRFSPINSRFIRPFSSLFDYSLSRPNPFLGVGNSCSWKTNRCPSVMASVSTVSTQKEVASGDDESTQKIPQPPLQSIGVEDQFSEDEVGLHISDKGSLYTSEKQEELSIVNPKPLTKIARRLEKFKTTIFTQMSMLAVKHGAINLGQGFPNFDGPEFVKEAAIQAIKDGKNQYARGYGVPDLNSAVAARFKKDTGLVVDPEKEITVTSGCTEAIAATMLGLINPGDEVILFAPFYDSYEATLSMAGAKIKCVTLRPPDFSVPLDELKSIVSKNTRAILINTPHNPTGKMFTREELNVIASLCIENDVLIITDEVNDKLAFEMDHISMASLPGMYERTVTLNSLGKTFSLTGWKIGWAVAPPHLTWGVRQAHSFLTFATSTPMQYAAATALRALDSYYVDLKKDYMAKKAILVDGLKAAGFIVYPSSGTYFIIVDHTPFGLENDVSFCEHLIKEVGVVAIPTSVFYLNPEDGKNLVRFTFCKDEETLRSAVDRMKERLTRKL